MHLSGSPPPRRLRFVRNAKDARTPADDNLTIVLDTAWTPVATDRSDVRPLRSVVGSVVELHDLFAEAMTLLDRWADRASIADIVTVEGVTYWYRLREELWHWTQERLLWRYVLGALDPSGVVGIVSVPGTEAALLDIARAMGWVVEVDGDEPPPQASIAPESNGPIRRFVPAVVRRAVRRVLPRTVRGRHRAFLNGRLRALQSATSPAVLVLSAANIYQRIGGATTADSSSRRDPNLGSVIDAIGHAGMQPVVVGGGLDAARPDDWELVEHDGQLIPWNFVQARWGNAEDHQRSAAAIAGIESRLGEIENSRFLLDDLDFTKTFVRALRGLIVRTVHTDVQQLAQAERMIEDLGPQAILMTHEGHRVPWLIAGSRAGVPTFTVQHGILYAAHPGYPHRRHPTLVLPTCTFVFGEYERRALLGGAYRPSEVVVSGSPRLDVLRAPTDRLSLEADRTAVRSELGVADGDLMLVISTVSLPFMQRFHFIHMLEAVLGGPLPGVHLIFKQHPSEVDEGPYRALLDGLARSRGYEAPPMTVVKNVDLHRLLRAADAHLGQTSTVISDAVVAGTPNLIAIVEPGGDILGYVQAGVARPVSNAVELLQAFADLSHPDPDARQAFLADHFREGVASERISEAIGAVVLATREESKVGAD